MGECFLYRRGGGGSGAPVIPEVEKTVFGRSLVLTDSTSKPLKGLRLFGRTTQAGTPSPDNPVPLVSPGDGGSITVEVGASSGDQNPQRLVFNTPNGLPGLKVASGGNMADENGQQWACDEIDFARGKYIHRAYIFFVDGSVVYGFANGVVWHFIQKSVFGGTVKPNALCNLFRTQYYGYNVPGNPNSNDYNTLYVAGDGSSMSMNISLFPTPDDDGFKAYFSANPMTIVAEATEPFETDLTAEELAQYAALHTNSLYTTISNTAGADMEVTYIAIGG